jgi:hypothetical protein
MIFKKLCGYKIRNEALVKIEALVEFTFFLNVLDLLWNRKFLESQTAEKSVEFVEKTQASINWEKF